MVREAREQLLKVRVRAPTRDLNTEGRVGAGGGSRARALRWRRWRRERWCACPPPATSLPRGARVQEVAAAHARSGGGGGGGLRAPTRDLITEGRVGVWVQEVAAAHARSDGSGGGDSGGGSSGGGGGGGSGGSGTHALWCWWLLGPAVSPGFSRLLVALS